MLISNSIKILIESQKHKEYIDKYVRDKFYESQQYLKYKEVKTGFWCGFKEYNIISEDKIEIIYEYGVSDSVYTDKFIIDIKGDIREQNIEEIFKKY
jgi:hypothetical protein